MRGRLTTLILAPSTGSGHASPVKGEGKLSSPLVGEDKVRGRGQGGKAFAVGKGGDMTSRRSMLLAGGLAVLLLALALWALRDLREQPLAQRDNLSLQESVEVAVTSEASTPPSGGTSDSASIRDSLQFTIRDASGKIKRQETTGGK